MKPIESEYYGHELYDDCIYRVREDEFELYVGKGKWDRKDRLLFEYQYGVIRTLYPMSNKTAQELMMKYDDPEMILTPEYTERHKKLLKEVFGEDETLESMRMRAEDASDELFDIEGLLLPYIIGEKGGGDDDDIADDLITLICEKAYRSEFEDKIFPAPVCNHEKGVTSDNLGYCAGKTWDGVPYEAELSVADGNKSLTVIIPSVYDSNPESVPGYDEEKGQSYIETYYYENNGILDLDMKDVGEEDEEDVIWLNVNFLLDRDIFIYASNFWNGTVDYLQDKDGNDFTKISIVMNKGDMVWAHTDLEFLPFKQEAQ